MSMARKHVVRLDLLPQGLSRQSACFLWKTYAWTKAHHIHGQRLPCLLLGMYAQSHQSLPRGIPPSTSLQRSLVQFLSQWAPVVSVKLITHSSNGQLKCVFAEFANEDDATKALKGVRTTIFYHMHLRLEPARGDRTLRFTMYDTNMPCINVSYIWIQTKTSKTACMYRPKRAQDFPYAALTKKLLFDLASLFGGIDLVKEKTAERKPCFDVVFQHRDAAYSALQQLSAHALSLIHI